VVQAPAPERLIKGGLPTEAMIASVLVSKYAWHLPLYRQVQMLAAQGLDIKRSTLAFWVGYAACTPASGWEKGEAREPGRARARALLHAAAEVQVLRRTECLAHGQMHRLVQGARPSRTARPDDLEVFEEERPKLIPYRGRFDGFHALPASVSKTCLVRFDNNKYSVSASAVGRPVDIHAYAERVVIRQDGRIVAEHPRRYGRGATVYDPWHYVPVLARKPGALRNGAPFKDWVLPMGLERVRRKLAGSNDGDRQMVKILAAVLIDGLPAVEAACLQALSEGVHSADAVINILARQRDPAPAATILTPDALRLRHAPVATAPATINSGTPNPWNEAKSST
jgi:hypothetical protein